MASHCFLLRVDVFGNLNKRDETDNLVSLKRVAFRRSYNRYLGRQG